MNVILIAYFTIRTILNFYSFSSEKWNNWHSMKKKMKLKLLYFAWRKISESSFLDVFYSDKNKYTYIFSKQKLFYWSKKNYICYFTTAKQNKNINQSLIMKSFLFVEFYNVSFCIQLFFVSHLQEDFCIVQDHILACFFLLWIGIETFYNFFISLSLIFLAMFHW